VSILRLALAKLRQRTVSRLLVGREKAKRHVVVGREELLGEQLQSGEREVICLRDCAIIGSVLLQGLLSHNGDEPAL
jgi:hypothetical protein